MCCVCPDTSLPVIKTLSEMQDLSPPTPTKLIQSHLWLLWSDFRESRKLCVSSGALQASVSPAVELGAGGHRCCSVPDSAQRCNVIPEPTVQPPCQPLSQAVGLISPVLPPTCWHPQPLLSLSLALSPAAGRILVSWPELLTFAAGLADLSQMATL